jgi:formylglycine-generating enzyme required for sulfatase activity
LRNIPKYHATVLCLCGALALLSGPQTTQLSAEADQTAASFWQEIPSAAFKFEMALVPGNEDANIKPFYIARTELPWEVFDVFVYRLDENDETPTAVDAVTRPTKPYLPPDRGFGHDGYAAISMSFHSAQQFCKWLSHKSGKKYRLPTEAEWEHAALAGASGKYSFGDDVAKLVDFAWFADNAENTPHEIAKKKPNAWGLYDVHGNVAEWCIDKNGGGITCGGSYRDPAEKVTAQSRAKADPAWNASDPQIPKSQWWLADGPFVGFRVVCEIEDVKPQKNAEER